MDFSDALKYLKGGCRLTRKSWNGKRQYIELATHISYMNPGGFIRNAGHEIMGNKAIVFCSPSGVQVGWLATQSDLLSDDWVLFTPSI